MFTDHKESTPTSSPPVVQETSERIIHNNLIDKLINTQILNCPNLHIRSTMIIDKEQYIDKALEIMATNDILSLPVTSNANNKFYGIIDMVDIVTFVSKSFGPYTFTSYQEFDAVFKELAHFHSLLVRNMISGPWFNRSAGHFILENYSLFHACEMLCSGYRRLAVCDKDHNVKSIITLSTMLEYCYKNIELLSDLRYKKVKDLQMHSGHAICIKATERPLTAFSLMVNDNVSGLGVTDKDGRLIDVISIRDLFGLQMDSKSIWRLYGDITSLKNAIREQYHDTPHSVVTIDVEETIEQCLKIFSEKKIHRLFLVDKDSKPVKCISKRDILFNIIFKPEVSNSFVL